jgi:carbamoylphosphate synthase small subunit
MQIIKRTIQLGIFKLFGRRGAGIPSLGFTVDRTDLTSDNSNLTVDAF